MRNMCMAANTGHSSAKLADEAMYYIGMQTSGGGGGGGISASAVAAEEGDDVTLDWDQLVCRAEDSTELRLVICYDPS